VISPGACHTDDEIHRMLIDRAGRRCRQLDIAKTVGSMDAVDFPLERLQERSSDALGDGDVGAPEKLEAFSVLSVAITTSVLP
jgi:hypothetical protein